MTKAATYSRTRLVLSLLSFYMGGDIAMAKAPARGDEVTAAFEAVRKGDASRVGALIDDGDSVIPAIAPLLGDKDPEVRREAVVVLDGIDTRDAARAALRGLRDPSIEVAERAAGLVYRVALRDGPRELTGLDDALAASPHVPEPGAARLLLLGFSTGNEGVLRSSLTETRLVKIANGDPAVEAALPAAIALSRRGAREGRELLLKRIEEGATEDLEFLLRAIGMIDAPSVLQALARRSLEDQREIGDGLPSGVSPRRRIADLAVEAFTSRLQLQTGVSITPVKRYSLREIEKVRAAVSKLLPS